MAENSCETATPLLLKTTMSNVAKLAKSFAKKYAHRYQGNNCIDALYPSAIFPKGSHLKYAVQAFLCSKLFENFEIESFGIADGCTTFLDIKTEQAQNFGDYRGLNASEAQADPYLKKYSESKLKEVFPKGLDQELSMLFAEVAKAVWVLHKLAFSFDPRATIVRLDNGRNYDSKYMKSVVKVMQGHRYATIAFMVQPGFRVKEHVLRSLIYPDFSSKKVRAL